MKKHILIFNLLLVLLPFSTFATPNSQSAKLLENKEMEFFLGLQQYSTINTLIPNPLDNIKLRSVSYLSLPATFGGTLSSAFNLRIGINKWVEYQFQGGISSRFYFGPFVNIYTIFIPDFNVYAKTGAKIKLFEGTKLNGALLATAGIKFTIEPILNILPVTPVSAPYSTNITFEVTPLFDIAKKSSNKPVTYYFGFPTRLEYSLFEINHSGNVGLGELRRSFPNAAVSFLFGIENAKHKIIARHEFFFQYAIITYSDFNGNIAENIFADDWEIIGTEHLFSTGYCISLGGRTYRK
jgi:hypothetical protein